MAKKKKLNHRQIRRMRDNQSKKLTNKVELDEQSLHPAEPGLVVSRYGQHADIEDQNGDIRRVDMRRNIESLVAGDRISWRAHKNENQGSKGVIEAVEPRHSVLNRPDLYDGVKPVAANIDQVVVLSSIEPELSFNIIDRYLVAVEHMGSAPILAINKVELLTDSELAELDQQLDYYRNIGYQVELVSMKTNLGLEALKAKLADKISIVVGQSGVGKSSLVNRLLPEANVLVGEISDISGLGQHTTTVARLYHMPSGGELIDSPGVREFSLWHLSQQEIFAGFVEFAEHHNCKFRDCKHKTDPGCAIVRAVADGHIAEARLQNYLSIIDSLAQQGTRHRKI